MGYPGKFTVLFLKDMPSYSPTDVLQLLMFMSLFGIIGYTALILCHLNSVKVSLFYAFAVLGHLLCSIVFAHRLSDSYIHFFLGAHSSFVWYGTGFVQWLVWFVRSYISGDSYLGTVSFFSGIGLLGQVFYVIIYDHMALKLSQHGLCQARKIKWPYAILFLWPSYLYWTCGVGKDSLAFFGIALCLFAILKFKVKPLLSFFVFIFSFALIFMIRPYLFLVFASAITMGLVFFNRNIPSFVRLLLLMLCCFMFYLMLPLIIQVGQLSDFSYDSVVNRSYQNQLAQSEGTAIPVPTNNPRLLPLFLPWTMFANAFLPLFYPVHNLIAILASFENTVFLFFVFKFLRKKKTREKIIELIPSSKITMYFFLSGIGLLGLLNTNLGLAMRQKTMYTPIFLLFCCLVLVVSKNIERKKKP